MNTSKNNFIKLILIMFTLIVMVSVFFVDYYVYADTLVPWDIDVTLQYGNKAWNYCLSNQIDELTKEQIANRAVYSGYKGKLSVVDDLVSQGFSTPQAYSYVLYNAIDIVRDIEKQINAKPQNATVQFNSKSSQKFTYTEGHNGVEVDVNQLLEDILHCTGKGHCTISIPCKNISAITISQLKTQTTQISSFTTTFSTSNTNRVHNIKLAVNSIKGSVIKSGEQFSFNKVVGERTTARGYKKAKVIINGSYQDGVGGGVCQVSTTLYNAVLLAGLNVVRVASHTLQPGYVKAGFDAMVAYGSSDLVFVNNTGYTVYVDGYVQDNKLTFVLYGIEQSGIKRTRESVEIERVPFTKKTIFDSTKYPDVIYTDQSKVITKGYDLVKCQTYICTYKDNKLVKKQKLRIVTYKMVEQVIVKGQKERPTVEEQIDATDTGIQ